MAGEYGEYSAGPRGEWDDPKAHESTGAYGGSEASNAKVIAFLVLGVLFYCGIPALLLRSCW